MRCVVQTESGQILSVTRDKADKILKDQPTAIKILDESNYDD